MPMPQTFDLLFNTTVNTTGATQSIQGSRKNPAPQYPRPVRVTMSLDGQGVAAGVTIQLQTTIDYAAWVNWGQAFTLTSTGGRVGPNGAQGSPVVGVMNGKGCRAVSSGISGATPLVNCQIEVS